MVSTTPSRIIEYSSLSEIGKASKAIIEFAGKNRIWTFEGEMGAGKTTLIKAICEALQVEDNVTSPTFSLVNEYEAVSGEIIYHFDFYRIKNEREAMDIGVEEYFNSDSLCLIEWPSKIPNLLPQEALHMFISVKDTKRVIQLYTNRSQQ